MTAHNQTRRSSLFERFQFVDALVPPAYKILLEEKLPEVLLRNRILGNLLELRTVLLVARKGRLDASIKANGATSPNMELK